jgi:hypothetical protein
MRRDLRRWATIAMISILVPATFAQDPANEDPAVTALMTSRDIEQTLLDEDREAFRDLISNRRDVSLRWARIHNAIDVAVGSDEPGAASALERLTAQLEKVEGERAELLARERVLVEAIRGRLRRIPLLELRLAELNVRPRAEAGLLSGAWDVVLLPTDQRGTFNLRQTGAIVTGTYRLTGGFSGSLRGTLVQTKLYLERIDSKLGRSMELEARVSTDGQQIRGTWLSYELADGDGSNGQWSATRQGRGDSRDGADDGG